MADQSRERVVFLQKKSGKICACFLEVREIVSQSSYKPCLMVIAFAFDSDFLYFVSTHICKETRVLSLQEVGQ